MNTKCVVFFDLFKGKNKIGRVKIQLWKQQQPKTCQNFRQLCTGEYLKNGFPTGFKESIFYEITESRMKGGDYNNNNGTKGESIYGQNFVEATENKTIQIEEGSQWIVSMIKDNQGKCSSLFQIVQKWNNKKSKQSVPFGQVLDEQSIKTLKQVIQYACSEGGKGRFPVVVGQCGEM